MIRTGIRRFQDNLEALQHNFLLRGYFQKIPQASRNQHQPFAAEAGLRNAEKKPPPPNQRTPSLFQSEGILRSLPREKEDLACTKRTMTYCSR